jgi:hypothetical protein
MEWATQLGLVKPPPAPKADAGAKAEAKKTPASK